MLDWEEIKGKQVQLMGLPSTTVKLAWEQQPMLHLASFNNRLESL